MARNVTEQELDALLARTDAPRPAVEARDFHEPRWLSPEDLDAFQRPAKSAGAGLVEILRASLPSELGLDGVEVSESSLDSVLRSPRPESVTLVCEGPGGPSLATMGLAGALQLAELALGAADASSIAARDLSPLEVEIIERLLAQASARVAQAFGATLKEPRLVIDGAELARTLGSEGDRRRVAVRAALALGSNKLVLHFLLAGINPPPRKVTATPRDRQPVKGVLPGDIASTRVEISAVLSELEIMLTDLMALEAGDLIPLTVAPGDPITLRIEGEPCGRARFGEREGRIAVRLTEILRPVPTR